METEWRRPTLGSQNWNAPLWRAFTSLRVRSLQMSDERVLGAQMKELEPSDQDVIAAVQSGNRNAFAEIVRRYESDVARTVTAMLGSGDIAEEAGQMTMIKVYKGLAKFRSDASLKTYITRIAINTALDEIRRRRRWMARFRPIASGADRETYESIADTRDLSESYALRQSIQMALSKLKPDFRAVAVLRLVHGYSPAETAEILKIGEGTVFSRLSRARQQLKHLLASELNDD